ncbi:hypothetical protein D3C86_1707100 [compost metagenome]
MTRSSISPASIPARITAARMAWLAMLGDLRLLKAPRKALAMGVRAVERMTASFMVNVRLRLWAAAMATAAQGSVFGDAALASGDQALQQWRRLEPHLAIVTERLAVVLDGRQDLVQANRFGIVQRAATPGRKAVAVDPH